MPKQDLLEKLKNLTVEEFTTPCTYFLKPEDSIETANKIMQEKNIRHLPVLSSKKQVIGIVSERDLLSSYHSHPATASVEKIMTENPYSVPAHTKIYEVALYMSENKYGSAIVLYGENNFGIFTSTDALNALIEIVRGDL